MNLSHLEPSDCPLPNLQIFIACVISGIDLIFPSFYRDVALTSYDRGMSECASEDHPLHKVSTFLVGHDSLAEVISNCGRDEVGSYR